MTYTVLAKKYVIMSNTAFTALIVTDDDQKGIQPVKKSASITPKGSL